MRKNILILFLLCTGMMLPTDVLSQDFLVIAQGDTLRGKVKSLVYGSDKKVQITEAGKKKVIYPFHRVRAFSIDGEVYQPVKGPNGYTFMKLLKSGYLSLYSFPLANQDSYSGRFLVKRDGDGMEVPNLTFEKAMKKYLDDCPEVVNKLDSDLLNKKDLDKIIDEYNSCIERRTKAEAPVVASTKQQAAAPPSKALNAWDALENKVKDQPDFAEKANALEMISEIKAKIGATQKIPNFLIEGLKNSLKEEEEVKGELEKALQEVD